jgi:hypothetical protein
VGALLVPTIVERAVAAPSAGKGAGTTMEDGIWLNEPKVWKRADGVLEVTTDKSTDFWRETHYGFTRDSGHFLGVRTGASFTAQLRVEAAYEQLYDQAGIMVRVDNRRWVKAGNLPWASLPASSVSETGQGARPARPGCLKRVGTPAALPTFAVQSQCLIHLVAGRLGVEGLFQHPGSTTCMGAMMSQVFQDR